MDKMTVRDIDVSGKRILVRVDFNVPLDEKGKITDDSRIRAALPTLRYLIERGARVILISHLGRPKGEVVDRLRLSVLAQRLSQILGQQVGVATDCIGPEVEKSVASLMSGDVLFLENLRFHSDEETGSASFARALARLGDVFVNDAFGTSHRTHASIAGIAHYLPAVAGLLLEKEVDTLTSLLENPAHPFVSLLGGAKISDKIEMLENILDRVDCLLIGGAMAATFLKAKAYAVGKSLVEEDRVEIAAKLIDMATKNGVRLVLPVDVVVTEKIAPEAGSEVVPVESIPQDKMIVDIGPETIKAFGAELQRSKTVFWNGPLGVYEIPAFRDGTQNLARLLAQVEAISIIGGGSTAEVVNELGLAEKMTFVSTGGGASLRFLGGEKLPGVETLLDKEATPPLALVDIGLKIMKQIARPSPSKIVLLVMDGLGGLPDLSTGKTELETARTPNLDKLASKSICGLIDLVSPGITPGSSPGHLALFGYDPIRCNIGRGALEAIGIEFDLQDGDVAARGNFCTVGEAGLVADRRAGRITTQKCAELCRLLNESAIDDVILFVRPVREHRFIVVFRGDGLLPAVSDSDPQQVGVAPRVVNALRSDSSRTADIANKFIARARETLANHHPANMVLLRGFSRRPSFPAMGEVYKLKPAAIASYPMYRGLAKLVGMQVLESGTSLEDEFATLEKHYADHDYFFLHIKATDAAGEDGDFKRKVKVIEQVDRAIPQLTSLKPDVIVVTGDHSTPALLKSHSWHPVPVLLYARYCRRDRVTQFSESACLSGGLGRLPATQIMPLAMANALKLTKFGA